MDTNICVNKVFTDIRSDKQFRLLWIDPQRSDSYVFWLYEKTGVPRSLSMEEIEEGLKEGWLKEAEDPFALTREPTPEEKEHRDRLWEQLKDALLDEPGIFDKHTRSRHLKRIESKGGEKVPNLYRHLGRYWERGKTPDAFLPGFRARGGKGKRRLGYSRAKAGAESEFGKPIMPEDLMNFETAIRKYYLSKKERDLPAVYKKLLEDSYSVLEKGEDGKEKVRILPSGEIPTLRQFRYWYETRRDIKEEVTKRKGETGFELTVRAVTGKSDFGLMGPGARYQVDATVGDIYLVSQFDRSDIIGRPVMYFVMDTFSRIVTGMYVGLEGPSWAGMMMALDNAAADKVEYCHRFGIEITEEMWPCHHVPSVLLGDRGELESHKADNLATMLGIRVENAPPYRGDLKPVIERHFRTINDTVKPLAPGWVMPDDRQRGGRDYRLDAKLDIVQFTRIIINCVIFYNTSHYLTGFEKSGQMLRAGVEAVPVKLWDWGIRNYSGALKSFPRETVRLALMPQETGSVTEKGISFRKLFYSCPEAREGLWFENARKNGRYKVRVSYDPRDMSSIYVWDKDGDDVYRCSLLDWEIRFSGKSLDEVVFEQAKQDLQKKGNERAELEAAINLNRAIDAIVSDAEKMAPGVAGKTKAERIADIRENRKKEKEALRTGEAFTAGTQKNGQGGPPEEQPGKQPEGAHAQAPAISKQEWDEMTPIQRMLWEDLLERGNGDGGPEENS